VSQSQNGDTGPAAAGPAVDGSPIFPRERELLCGLPAPEGFLTVDELEASTDRQLEELPGLRAWVCGYDAAGREMRCLEVGDGPRRALLLGHVHPEEPVGTLVLEYLLRLFATTDISHRLGFRLSAIKVCDPTAARLNETWLSHPYDLTNYVRNVYRSDYADQPIWTFPVEYKGYRFDRPLPETKAMMAAIDAEPLDLLMPLHNCSFSGGYFYVSDADGELLDELCKVRDACRIPPHRGEPELPYLNKLSDGIYGTVTVAMELDYLASHLGRENVDVSAGCDAEEYADRRWHSHAVLAEAPGFTSDRVADTAPVGMSRGEAKLAGIAREEEHVAWLRPRYERACSLLGGGSPWQRAVAGYLADAARDLPAEKEQACSEPAFREEATTAERFDSFFNRELLTLCRLGQFGRMVAAQADRDAHLAELGVEVDARVRECVAAATEGGAIRPVPIRFRTQMQIGALLASMAYVAGRRGPA
jgi:hypothetical protein